MRHLIVHQIDPTTHAGAGINLIIEDLVHHAPPEIQFAVVGVDARGVHDLGKWIEVPIGGRAVQFMPVTRVNPGHQERRVPHTARLVAGVHRFRPRVGESYVHAHRADVGAALWWRYRRPARIQFIHGDVTEQLPQRVETFWRFLPRMYLALERRAVVGASGTIVVSRKALARLSQYSRSVAHSKLSWFDPTLFMWRDTGPRTPRIGWSGRLEPSKDPLLALEALAGLRSRGVAFSAWLAGAGTLEGDVRDRISALGLEGLVDVLGLLDPKGVADELSRSTAFLVSSRWEGLPRAALEALGSGLPVVTPDVGELRSAIDTGRTGFVVERREPEALAQALEAALELGPSATVAASVEPFHVKRVVGEIYDTISRLAPV